MSHIRVAGAFVAASAAALLGCNHLSGTFASTATPLGTWILQPTRCTASQGQLVLSSRADPVRYVTMEADSATTTTPTVLGARPFSLTVLDLSARDGAPLTIPGAQCRVLTMHASGSFSTRVNGGPWVNSYAGTADIDCPYPDELHRFVGHFEFTCPEE